MNNSIPTIIGILSFYLASQPKLLSYMDSSLITNMCEPTFKGHLAQTLIFGIFMIVLTFTFLRNSFMREVLWKAVVAMLLFYIISRPETYRCVNKYLDYGYTCSSEKGLIIHSLVFGLVLYFANTINYVKYMPW